MTHINKDKLGVEGVTQSIGAFPTYIIFFLKSSLWIILMKKQFIFIIDLAFGEVSLAIFSFKLVMATDLDVCKVGLVKNMSMKSY